MEQTITITKTEKGVRFDVTGVLAPFEVLGMLRYYEKDIWLRLQKGVENQSKKGKK